MPGDKPHYEFGGPVGAVTTTLALPLLVIGFITQCNPTACPPLSLDAIVAALPEPASLISPAAFGVTLAWFLIQVVIYVALPGPVVEGSIVPATGKRLKYKCNGDGPLSRVAPPPPRHRVCARRSAVCCHYVSHHRGGSLPRAVPVLGVRQFLAARLCRHRLLLPPQLLPVRHILRWQTRPG